MRPGGIVRWLLALTVVKVDSESQVNFVAGPAGLPGGHHIMRYSVSLVVMFLVALSVALGHSLVAGVSGVVTVLVGAGVPLSRSAFTG